MSQLVPYFNFGLDESDCFEDAMYSENIFGKSFGRVVSFLFNKINSFSIWPTIIAEAKKLNSSLSVTWFALTECLIFSVVFLLVKFSC